MNASTTKTLMRLDGREISVMAEFGDLIQFAFPSTGRYEKYLVNDGRGPLREWQTIESAQADAIGALTGEGNVRKVKVTGLTMGKAIQEEYLILSYQVNG